MEEKNNEQEEREVEVLEFSLTRNEIDELIEKLGALKKTKTSISFDVDEENEFIIHYEIAGDVLQTGETNKKENGDETSQPKENQEIQKEQYSESGEIPNLDDIERQ